MDINKLYPYQNDNAINLAGRQFGCDLSEVGTGKTVTAFGVIHYSYSQSVLIIAPKSVSAQWQNKIDEFYPSLTVFRALESNREARLLAYRGFYAHNGGKVLIITYEQARMDIEIIKQMNFDICYADEIHRLGNALTKTWKAINQIPCSRRYGATATPLRSSPLQAFGIFNWLSPGLLGKNFYHFKAKYTITNNQGWVLGYKNLDELGRSIRPYYVKTTMEDAGHFLPELVEEDIIFPLSKAEQDFYDKTKKEMILDIDKKLLNKMENPTNLYLSVVKLGKMQEITDSQELLGEGTLSSKIDILKEHLEDNLTGDNKVVIFTRFSRMCLILQRELQKYNPAIITGSIKDREAEIQKFINDDKSKVIIGTTAMSEGIDGLQKKANIIYMVDVPLGSYGMLTQIKGRINRHGQKEPMVVYYLMAEGTVDVKLKKLLLSKQEMSEKIFKSLAKVKEILE